jgi:hypothetical protein
MTAIDWLEKELGCYLPSSIKEVKETIHKAKQIEIYQTDNKVISFAEWLTGERATRLMELYGEFEEEFYPKEKL